jgi:hydrogenase-4 component E
MEGAISFADAGRAIDLAALGLLALALFGAIVRRLDSAILLLALQGVLLGVASAAAALAEMHWLAWAAFSVAVTVNAVAIPLMLRFTLARLAVKHEVETAISAKIALPIAAALVPLSYRAIGSLTERQAHGFDAPNALPTAMALLLLGLFTMTIRKTALTQVIGLVTMENGLYLAAVAATRGLPFAVEFGVALDVLTGVAVMGLVMHEINHAFGSVNTDHLRTLRG